MAKMSFNHSYQPDYFSLIEIGATEERMQCTIVDAIPKLGFLDTSSDTEDLKAGTKLEIPFWMVQSLYKNTRKISSDLKCDIPKVYTESYREILSADSSVVPLSRWNQYYYEFGMYLSNISTQKEKILPSLIEAFKNRFQFIMDHAFSPISSSMVAAQLPALEREIYTTGQKYSKELMNWIEKGTKKIETADVIAVINMKKRKRMEINLD